jgi:hypothetical protein
MFALATLAVTGACSRSTTLESGGDVDVSPTPVSANVLPTGATVNVTLDQEIGTKNSKVGQEFTATVAEAITTSGGETVIPAGTKVHGTVTGLDDSDHAGEPAAIRLDFDRIVVNGQNYPFEARVTATNLKTQGADTRDETLKKAGVGAAAGALLGAIIGDGDLSKILGGAAIGAAAGTVISLGTGDVEAVLPSGTRMTLQTTQQVAM